VLEESSLSSFGNAIRLGVSTLELDLQITEDGQAVGCGPLRITRRSKTRLIWSGRPMSRLSRMTCSKKIRPLTGFVQHLGQGELGLQDRQVVAVAGGPVRGGERVR
jgi:hypothetical protein